MSFLRVCLDMRASIFMMCATRGNHCGHNPDDASCGVRSTHPLRNPRYHTATNYTNGKRACKNDIYEVLRTLNPKPITLNPKLRALGPLPFLPLPSLPLPLFPFPSALPPAQAARGDWSDGSVAITLITTLGFMILIAVKVFGFYRCKIQ